MTLSVYHSLEEFTDATPRGRVVAIGVFDGVHRGHQRILGSAVQEAQRLGAPSMAVTFYPHPEAVLSPRSAPRMLTSLERKAALLAELGLDEMLVVRFSTEFAQLSPELFCRAVLSARLGARVVFVGKNFHFGHFGAGTPADLERYGATHGFEVRSVGLVEDGGETISSTRIRELLRAGHVAEAAHLLGRPHRIEGTVTRGYGRGRGLEAPTANLTATRQAAVPRLGVYATRAIVDRQLEYGAVTSVGTNPTFGSDRRVHIETLLLDFEGELYDHHLAVDFLERIRGQKTFADPASLAEQIRLDVEAARRLHASRAVSPEGT
ncbi:MAG: bifunctional riboflavin kinase/FAD synthetase [Thermoleophilia bacterium]|nr:bifunctional riboflavin kinase/FAD synthetase [Thermoleophilia bacterium]